MIIHVIDIAFKACELFMNYESDEHYRFGGLVFMENNDCSL